MNAPIPEPLLHCQASAAFPKVWDNEGGLCWGKEGMRVWELPLRAESGVGSPCAQRMDGPGPHHLTTLVSYQNSC